MRFIVLYILFSDDKIIINVFQECYVCQYKHSQVVLIKKYIYKCDM